LKNLLNKYLNNFVPTELVSKFYNEATTQERLDGTVIKRFLENHGFVVITNFDKGRNGIAITQDHYVMSTNGYFYKGMIN